LRSTDALTRARRRGDRLSRRALIELDSASGRRFEELYAIYESSLAARERKKRAEVEALIGRAGYRVLALESDEHVIAFSMLFVSRAGGIALLEYMATDAAHRNAGLGAEIFERSLAHVDALPLLVEVDSDREPAPDRAIRARRKRFYRRCGCLSIEGLEYRLPLAGRGAPPQMDLLIHPNGRPLQLSKRRLREWLEAVFVEVYGQRPDDPRIAGMIEPLRDPIPLSA
jgi:hypothetical protein